MKKLRAKNGCEQDVQLNGGEGGGHDKGKTHTAASGVAPMVLNVTGLLALAMASVASSPGSASMSKSFQGAERSLGRLGWKDAGLVVVLWRPLSCGGFRSPQQNGVKWVWHSAVRGLILLN